MTHEEEIEQSIAWVFGRKFKMVPEYHPGKRPNVIFFSSEDAVHKGKKRGTAYVMRYKMDLKDYRGNPRELFWGDQKGMILIGFNDLCVFMAHDRDKFSICDERSGLYE